MGASDTKTSTVQTISGNADSVLITADSAGAVNESNETNNTRTTSYTYAPAQPGDVPVDGTTQTILNFVTPLAVNWSPLIIGSNQATRSLTVTSNTNWQVTLKGTNNGYMTKFQTPNSYDPLVHLHDAMYIYGQVNGYLSGADQQWFTGTPTGQQLDGSGDTRSIVFSQQVYYADPALDSNHSYHVVVTFTASTTGY